MRHYGTLTAVSFAAALVGCGASVQQQNPQIAASACAGLEGTRSAAELYGQGKITKVEPIRRQVFLARAIQPTLTYGARLYVPATADMHEAYLQRVLSCHAASRSGTSALANDPLRVPGVVSVKVDAHGPLMRISVEGKDQSAGEAIWHSARSLHGEVSVEQLAAGDAPGASL
jgi:hypothetical protein